MLNFPLASILSFSSSLYSLKPLQIKHFCKYTVLCSQFLRSYVNIPQLKDIRPEDIENVSDQYIHMFMEERNSDIVNRIHLKRKMPAKERAIASEEEEIELYLISLIEHKSKVDYNVIMQIFWYMAFIWENYEKEMEQKQEGISKTKNFRYPLILPIVYYEGTEKWTAATKLKDRIFHSDLIEKYIPDFEYELVQLRNYSNEKLTKKEDELSAIFLVSKVQSLGDLAKLNEDVPADYMERVTKHSPDYLLDIMAKVVEALLLKINVPIEEAELYAGQIKERHMGELFENLTGYDVQATRREEHEKTEREVTERVTKQVTEQVTEWVTKQVTEQGIKNLIEVLKEVNSSKEYTAQQLMKKYFLDGDAAKEKIALYW